MNGIREDDERVAYCLWAEGTIPQGYKHLVPQPDFEKDPVLQTEAELPSVTPMVPVSQTETELPPATPMVPADQTEEEAPPPAPMVPVVPIKTTIPTPLPAVPLQKELLVSTPTDDAPKAPDITKCEDPMKVVQKYKAYFRIQNQRCKGR